MSHFQSNSHQEVDIGKKSINKNISSINGN